MWPPAMLFALVCLLRVLYESNCRKCHDGCTDNQEDISSHAAGGRQPCQSVVFDEQGFGIVCYSYLIRAVTILVRCVVCGCVSLSGSIRDVHRVALQRTVVVVECGNLNRVYIAERCISIRCSGFLQVICSFFEALHFHVTVICGCCLRHLSIIGAGLVAIECEGCSGQSVLNGFFFSGFRGVARILSFAILVQLDDFVRSLVVGGCGSV